MPLSMDQLDDIHAYLDAMTQAVSSCKSGEWTAEEMWLEIEAQSQALSTLAAETGSDGADDDEEDSEDVAEINFDEDEDAENVDPFADAEEEL